MEYSDNEQLAFTRPYYIYNQKLRILQCEQIILLNVNIQLAIRNVLVSGKGAVYCWNTLRTVGFWPSRKISDCPPTITSDTWAEGYAHVCHNVIPRTISRGCGLFVGITAKRKRAGSGNENGCGRDLQITWGVEL